MFLLNLDATQVSCPIFHRNIPYLSSVLQKPKKDSRFRQSWSRWVLLASIRDSHFSASSTLGEVGWPVLVDGLRAEETSITARLLWEILVDLRFQDNVLFGLPWLIWGIFVFWFSVTNCHWLSSLKQHSHLLTVLWVRSLAACGRILC